MGWVTWIADTQAPGLGGRKSALERRPHVGVDEVLTLEEERLTALGG